MGMKRLLVPAFLLLSAPLFADAPLLDPRLSDADEFGRYADVSRPRAGAVASPDWSLEAGARRPAASLSSPAGIEPAARRAVPSVPVLSAPREDRERRVPAAGLLGLAVLGAAAAGAAVLLIASASSPRRAPPGSGPAEVPAGEVVEELPDIQFYAPPPAAPIVVSPPAAPPPPAEPVVVAFEPELTQSWLAITAEEQRAIDAWDRSVEKELGLASLEAWLDGHASEFPRLDVACLKAKLYRGA